MTDERDSKGRYLKGRDSSKEPIEVQIKRKHSLQKSWRDREDYISDLIQECPYIYNSWRGIMFSDKSKKIGCDESWRNFKVFYKDVRPTYQKGLVFRRLDVSKPFSKDNFIWITKEESHLLQSNLVILDFEGLSLSLKQWADKLGQSLYSIKNRYYKREKYNYSIYEVLYGRKKKRFDKKPKDYKDSNVNIRAKVSKMISSYKHKDKSLGISECDIDIDWMISNIITNKCVYCGDDKRIGCDRIDNNKGHTKDNVVPCCYDCNVARGNNFTHEEMKIIGESIRLVKDKRT